MAATSPNLPPRFPCWCKAVYSWGGETKRDLGFIEGDLIECLNAGDGSWWMGRLRRDKRMVGLFPSNFVQVLDESFRPTSPMPSRASGGGSLSRPTTPSSVSPQKSKSVFRKPFQAYASGNGSSEPSRRESLQSGAGSTLSTPTGSLKSHRPYSAMKRSREDRQSGDSLQASSPRPLSRHGSGLGTNSPRPLSRHGSNLSYMTTASPAPVRPRSRAASPAPSRRDRLDERAASPLPAAFSDPDFHMRAPSPSVFPSHLAEGGSSPPPPAPPPHRVAYQPSRAPSPQLMSDDSVIHHKTVPPSPGRSQCTPSPLTHAMNDVMSSLQDMTAPGAEASPDEDSQDTHSVWSPDAFEEMYASSAQQKRRQNFAAKHQDSGYGSVDDQEDGGMPQLGNYVQRMESRLRKLHEDQEHMPRHQRLQNGPTPPRKNSPYEPIHRPQSSTGPVTTDARQRLRARKSAYELGRAALSRTFTHKSSSTNATTSTKSTQHSLMSGASAGGFSATSAGSLARKRGIFGEEMGAIVRPFSAMNSREDKAGSLGSEEVNGMIDLTSSQAHRGGAMSVAGYHFTDADGGTGLLGGLSAPTPKKRGFFKKLVDTAKTGAASARSTIAAGGPSRPQSRAQSAMGRPSMLPNGITAIAGGMGVSRPPSSGMSAAQEMGLGGPAPGSAIDWVQIRRDVNRSNSISVNERAERFERAQMMDQPALSPIDLLDEHAEGDEGLDGLPVAEPTDFASGVNLSLVDRSARFVANLPPTLSVAGLAQGYVCRPYRSDVQRLRAIFTWVSERIAWEEAYDEHQAVDCRRVMMEKRGSSREIAHFVVEMCQAVGLCAEVAQGYLKPPGEQLAESFENLQCMRPNHWWNTVIVDGEWRILDCSLASPTFARRALYSGAPSQQAEDFYFLTRPMHAAFTHVPMHEEQQHIVPRLEQDVLLALPAACPPYFKQGFRLVDYDTSSLFLENLEMAQITMETPEDYECVAELEVREFTRDMDGDLFESGEFLRLPALCQAEWMNGRKRWVVKAVLPEDEGRGVLKIYGGKRGLMHSVRSNPHALCLALPIAHSGKTAPYAFFTRHPTPHAQRHDLYVAQPQCRNLAINNTFVFTIRQHPSCVSGTPSMSTGGFSISRPGSALGSSIARPSSAMSMTSVSVSGSQYSNAVSTTSSNSTGSNGAANHKPAKLAIQSPSGKIMRVTRKQDAAAGTARDGEGDGSVWETVIKVGERGTWRGLVLADRSARWCVFGEWECF